MKKCISWAVLITVALVLAVTPGRAYAVPPVQTGQNLLINPGFEGPYTSDGAANGWVRWHQDSGNLCSTKPEDWNFVCKPSWSQELDVNQYGLTRSGS